MTPDEISRCTSHLELMDAVEVAELAQLDALKSGDLQAWWEAKRCCVLATERLNHLWAAAGL